MTTTLRLSYFFILLTLTSCGLDCIDKKTGQSKSCETITESVEKNLFKFEMQCNQDIVQLEDGNTFRIKNAWVENGWSYECVNNHAVVTKRDYLQLLLNGTYFCSDPTHAYNYSYTIWDASHSRGTPMADNMQFHYTNEDTVILNLVGNKGLKRTIKFYRQVSH